MSENQPAIAGKAPVKVQVEAGKTYHWCACGKSQDQPICDGSHKGTGFTPLAWTADQTGEKYFCACKQSKAAPFCDGSHKSL
jgi:CDGSH iron-sulfur domain-containing protein 3